MGTEIERKFLVKEAPENFGNYSFFESSQGYLDVTSPEKYELRVRRKGKRQENRNFLTIKKGNGLQRDELEVEIPLETYVRIWPLTKGKRIEKTRYEIPYMSHIIELDVYKNDLEGLVTAEVEFLNLEESQSFAPPSWFGKEITEDERYKNRNLAVNGIPK